MVSQVFGSSTEYCDGIPSQSSSIIVIVGKSSAYFLALSHAPPELDWEMASCTAEIRDPTRRPLTASTPKKAPVRMGEKMTSMAGFTISRRDSSVDTLMHAW